MLSFIKRYIASIVLFISILINSIEINVLGKPASHFINIQLILIYAFKISNPNLNFSKGISLFVLSIINDALIGHYFGTSGLLFFIVFGVAVYQASIKLRSVFVSEWISFCIAIFLAYLIFFGIEHLQGHKIIITQILINLALTIFVYPLFWVVISKLLSPNAYR